MQMLMLCRPQSRIVEVLGMRECDLRVVVLNVPFAGVHRQLKVKHRGTLCENTGITSIGENSSATIHAAALAADWIVNADDDVERRSWQSIRYTKIDAAISACVQQASAACRGDFPGNAGAKCRLNRTNHVDGLTGTVAKDVAVNEFAGERMRRIKPDRTLWLTCGPVGSADQHQ